ncbi:MAG TPA: protein kinase [Anaerolineae bacterium]|nr:protein kinase [Anaerolineae bacterium]
MSDMMYAIILGGILALATGALVLYLRRRKLHAPDDTIVPPTATAPPASPKLVLLEGTLAGQEFKIPTTSEGLTLGRDTGNDVKLTEDILVSRQHAQILRETEDWVLYDRDSVNGVFVNNQRVMRHVLRHGDVIQMGNTRCRFDAGSRVGAPAPIPSPPARPRSNSMQLSANAHFGGYVLDGEVGRGGMSVVYKAHDSQQRVVAIKVLDVDDDYVVRKFIQEGEIGTTLRDHPNICRVYDSGRGADNRFYLVMEFIEGVSLRRMTGQRLTEAQIVAIIGQVCDALHYAHLRNIVHRDIKPENVMVDIQGRVKVTDFGIAKLTSSITVTTDRTVGTPEYVSPEQAQGQRVLAASDIYSVGVVLYELLTGRPPFPLPQSPNVEPRAATMSVLIQHIHSQPIPPTQVVPGLPPYLEQIALTALQKDPRKRFASAWEMACALGYRRTGAPSPAQQRIVAQLVVIQGNQVGKTIPLDEESAVLGRAEIAPEDGYISTKHLTITLKGAQLWLLDTSRNGTWVNGERVFSESPLKQGDVIKVGSQSLRFEDAAVTPSVAHPT